MANLSNINNILRTGSLGVGINRDPLGAFEISSATKPGVKMFNTAASGKTYEAYSDANGNYIIYDQDANDNRFVINTSGNATFAGNVNISSPGDLYINSGTSYNNVGSVFLSNQRTEINSIIVDGTAQGDTAINFKTRSAGSTASAMFIDEFRRVGIGTSSPDEKLDITGGYLKFNGGDYGLKGSASLTYNATSEHYFYTGGTERMRIGSNGLVSLPTTGLNDTRHIIFTGTQGVANNAGNLGMWGNEVRLTGNWYYNGAQQKVVAGNGMGVMGIGVGTTDAACYLTFGVNGPAATGGPTERMRISSSGNVGIGFSAGHDAITKLELPGSLTNSSLKAGTLEMQSYSVNNAWLADNVYYNGAWYLRSNGYASQVYFGSGGDISFKRFATGNAGTVATPVLTMQLDSAGNVGIGKSQSGNAVLTARSSAGGNTGIILIEGDTTDDGWGVYATTANKYIITRFTAGSYSDKFTILEGGNVGIGAASPSSKLQVGDGTANVNLKVFGSATSGIQIHTASGNIASLEQYFANEGSLWLRLGSTTKVLVRANDDSYFNGGYVGIGTTNPGAELHVVGRVKTTRIVSSNIILGNIRSNIVGTSYLLLVDLNVTAGFSLAGKVNAASYTTWNVSDIYVRKNYNATTGYATITGISKSGSTLSVVDISHSSGRFIALKLTGDPEVDVMWAGYRLDALFQGSGEVTTLTSGVTENSVYASY